MSIAVDRDTLTPKELDVLNEWAAGVTERGYASAHWLAIDTVRSHRRSIRAKLGARNGANAVAIAIRRGLIQ